MAWPFALCFLLVSTPATGLADDRPAYALETREVRRIQAVVEYGVTAPRMRAQDWIGFAAVAPELPGQVQVKTTTVPKGKVVKEASPLHRSVVRMQVAAASKEDKTRFKMQVTYEATLRARHLRLLEVGQTSPVVPDLTPADRKNLLASFGDIDHQNGAFRGWLESAGLMRAGTEPPIEFARRAFLYIRANFSYRFREKQDRRASSVCIDRWSDCGGLSVLLVAVLRANGIPARVLYGRWATSARGRDELDGQPYYQWHVKAEFHAAGVGWVPVDMSSAILHDRSPAGLRYFGNDPGDFIAFHVDPNLEVDTVYFGRESINNLQTPAYWVRGGGYLGDAETSESWQVKRLPPVRQP
jgi:transglutaminase-like putative cysteine protease